MSHLTDAVECPKSEVIKLIWNLGARTEELMNKKDRTPQDRAELSSLASAFKVLTSRCQSYHVEAKNSERTLKLVKL